MSGTSGVKYNLDLVIDSKYRTNYSSTNSNDFNINIPSKIEGQVVRYGLKSCMIPNTILIGGSFEIEDSIGVKVITIPSANYTAETLRAELETQLNLAGTDTYTVTLSNNKYTITSSYNNFTINPNDIVSPNGILFKIGFGISGIYVATIGVITSYAGINLSYPNYIFINIAQFAKHIKNITGDFHSFIVPNTCSYGKIISFNPESQFIQQFIPYQFTFPNDVQTLSISLQYSDGTLINLENSDWSFVLTMEVISNFFA